TATGVMRFARSTWKPLWRPRGTLLVVDESELKDDLVQDMISVLTSFCARLYGRRSAKHRAEKAIAVMAAGGMDPVTGVEC
ncbi:transposon resolvase, partial [Acidithiobacillus sp. GGI-221]